MPFILLPLKNPFVFFDKKKKKKKKKKKRVRFAPLSKRRANDTHTGQRLMFRAAAREALRTVSRRHHQRGGGGKVVPKNDSFRRSMSGGGSIEEERGTFVLARSASEKSRVTHYFSSSFLGSLRRRHSFLEKKCPLSRARVVRRVESADAKKNLPPNFLSF